MFFLMNLMGHHNVVCLGLDSRLTLFERVKHSNKSIIKANMYVEVM